MRNGDEFIASAQAAPILGYSVAWVNKLASKGRLPVAHKMTGKTGAYLFRKEELEQFAENRSQQPAA